MQEFSERDLAVTLPEVPSEATVAVMRPISEDVPNELELSIVMPCLNEAETLEACIRKASSFLRIYNVRGEIVIGDNGSSWKARLASARASCSRPPTEAMSCAYQ